jgi:hypothetical protein
MKLTPIKDYGFVCTENGQIVLCKCRFYCQSFSMFRTNTLAYYIICTFSYITNLSCFIVQAQFQFTGSPIILSTALIALKIHPCYLEMGSLAKPSVKLCLLWQGILNEGGGSVQLTNSLRQLVL